MFYPQIVKTGKTPTGSLQTLANWVSTAEYSPDLQVVYSLAVHHTNPVRWCQRLVIHLTSMQIFPRKKMAHWTQTLPTKIGATSKFRSTLERSWDVMSFHVFRGWLSRSCQINIIICCSQPYMCLLLYKCIVWQILDWFSPKLIQNHFGGIPYY